MFQRFQEPLPPVAVLHINPDLVSKRRLAVGPGIHIDASHQSLICIRDVVAKGKSVDLALLKGTSGIQ